MANVDSILKDIASVMGRSTTGDFTTAAGASLGFMGLNNARVFAERAVDFHYSELDCSLSIGTTGGNITSAYVDTTVTVTGTLSPTAAGTFTQAGTRNALPFFIRTTGGVDYFLSYTGTAWAVTTGGFTLTANFWDFTTASTNPAGTYTAHGTNTGVMTVAQTTGTILIKRVVNVELTTADGDSLPIEFLQDNERNRRVRRAGGREAYNTAKTLAVIGNTQVNPLAYQQGQIIKLDPATGFTFPVVAKLSVVRFMPDYTTTSDTDYFTQFAPDYLIWRGAVEINTYFRRFSPKTEGNINPEFIAEMADAAFQALLAWNASLVKSTSTPEQAPAPAPKPQAA